MSADWRDSSLSPYHSVSWHDPVAHWEASSSCAASGLLWLAELIEEHSRYAKSIGIRAIYVSSAVPDPRELRKLWAGKLELTL